MPCPMCHKEHKDSLKQALTTLAGTPRRLENIIGALSVRQAGTRPAPGKWSSKEIVSHLADCELVFGIRYRKIIAEPGSTLVAFDQDAWAKGLRYETQTLKTSLPSFSALRAQNLALLKMLPAKTWRQGGQHPEYGTLTLEHLVRHLATHDANHATQIGRLAAGFTKKTTTKTQRTRSNKKR